MSSEAQRVLGRLDHRPYPISDGSWAISMSWHDLLFMHWPVAHDALRPLVPPRLRLDTFEGSAWIGVVPFRMSGVRPRFAPAIPALSDFPELNLRTYVTSGGRPGVWFFSLDAQNQLAVRLARSTLGLPYFDARMASKRKDDTVSYRSERTHRRAPLAGFDARYRPVAEVEESPCGSIERFLTARYCLYSSGGRGEIKRGEIHHEDWPLRRAEAEVKTLGMTEQIGLSLPDTDPLLHFSERLDVLAWPPKRLEEKERPG